MIRQEAMDAARLKFANIIKSFNRWLKDTIEDAKDANFGNTLEAVQAYQETLNTEKQNVMDATNQKRAELQAANDELVGLGVKDNKYTILTLAVPFFFIIEITIFLGY